MPTVLPFEKLMWVKEPKPRTTARTDEDIAAKYDQKTERIVTETNREKLQNFYEALNRPGYMDPRPFYQRRQRWDAKRQSLLIESFLINIPIPPLFVYETKPNVYEVMDGQQRISAIKAFYSNELILSGLERWSELNGRTYSRLPDRIRAGIDRRSITWITVLNESTENEEEAFVLKQLVFERLNTGGVQLSHQEIRNALFAGPFNDLLISLSRNPNHRKAWNLPLYSEAEERGVPDYLEEKTFYREMEDVEVILRFFALRNAEHYQRGMRGFLDLYMMRAKRFSSDHLGVLKELYERTISLGLKIYQDLLFKPFNPAKGEWGTRPQKAYADAVLVSLSGFLDNEESLVPRREEIIEKTKALFAQDPSGILTGRGNTKKDVTDRISWMIGLFASI